MGGADRYAGLDDELVAVLKKFDGSVQALQKALAPLVATDRKTFTQYPALTQAKLAICAAYSSVAVYYIYLRAKGAEVGENHPIQEELQKVRRYLDKVQQIVPQAKVEEERLKTQLMKTRVNKEATKRLLTHELGLRGKTREAAFDADAAAEEEEEMEEIEEVEEVEEDVDAEEAAPPAKRARQG
eukprot:TRINITY_DN2802_c6_g1_i1.p1 TRINITY_DN2802_c6_g1~~TRINITY_DN2802_c6_g1_i1.p1  ORF type:complete len:205 (+),score=82.34 TRINITY_DN2802_c6_g1_i1:63-617(+)